MAPGLLSLKGIGRGLKMEKKIKDTRAVKLERVLSGDYIPMFGGRPVRDDLQIAKDDLLNLTIALNTTDSVEDFLRKM
jgi:hypothetical protein